MPAAIIRNTGPRGPRFYEDGDKLMFVNVVDASTRDGPRLATDADMEAHPGPLSAMGSNEGSTFPGAKPMITFSGERPPSAPDPARLAKAPPPYVEPEPPETPPPAAAALKPERQAQKAA